MSLVRGRTCGVAFSMLCAAAALAQDESSDPLNLLCYSMTRMAEAARDGHARKVSVRTGPGTISTEFACKPGKSSEEEWLCAVLQQGSVDTPLHRFAQSALDCIGDEGPPLTTDPDAIVGHSFWIRGKFSSKPPHFADGKVRIEVDFETPTIGPKKSRLSIAAIPLRGK